MLLMCPKCKKQFDPEKESVSCSPYFGHMPVKPSGQKLPDSLLETKEKKKADKPFQSDFGLIWHEETRWKR